VADTAYFGPEPEFFIFDSVRWRNEMQGASFEIDSEEAAWSSNRKFEEGNAGHRPGIKGGYFPVAPVDSLGDIRGEICKILETMGMVVEVHHHEVATAGQCEIGTKFNTLTKKGDELLSLKYAVKNVAHRNGKTATFMPKPIVGDNGSGMHVHQSLAKGGVNLFAGDLYGGLSQTALYYIGGIFKHARAINAFTNSTTNSYKRLVPGFEAPVMLAYSARNRSASCRIPFVHSPKARRIEVRFPDPMNSGYLTFTALMMAGIDGILNKIDPGAPADKDLYDLPPEEEKNIPTVCHALDQALEALDKDRGFLKAGGRVQRRLHRCVHRTEAAGSHEVPHVDASDRVSDVLLDLMKKHRQCCFDPSPFGRGVGVRVGSCTNVDKCPDPHPALRATFSRWEKGWEQR
jgi:glutamine synthetase